MKSIRSLFKLFIFFLIVFFLSDDHVSADTKQYDISRFISPEICGDCHSDIYSQWENSMHNLSHKDPVYKSLSKFLLKGLSDKDEIAEAESCVKCHTPVGVVSGFPEKTSDDLSKTPKIATKGIQCDYCHSAVSIEKMYNNGLKLDPGYGEDDPGTKRGPFRECESDFHETAFSKIHTGSEICGTCHNVKHVAFNTNLETTYDEWKNSPYNSGSPEKRITCQGCHMHQRPGIPSTGSTERPANPGYASDDGPKREHIFTHYFVGANRMVPGMFGDKIKVKMAEERLKNAASISMDTSRAKKGKLKIKVTNTGAGHYLPTGLADVRQMWLEIKVKDKRGAVVYSSGILDENGYIPEGTKIFNTVFGDGRGKPVLNIAKAREILKDSRIPPGKSAIESINLPEGLRKNITVNIRLLYRSAPQKVLDMVEGKGKIKLPVVTMTEIEKTI
jgi:hypothetical protein